MMSLLCLWTELYIVFGVIVLVLCTLCKCLQRNNNACIAGSQYINNER